ncbi:MAG: alcohol dehydrogenase catalytic domain-containing protein [Thermoleophilia bacterium]|nr:alcohol dehydrogenase catalytic domain-containing protein [Thermoleophilia bacterium]
MRAAIYHGGGSLSIDEVPAPEAGPGEIVIRTRQCGICGTDLMAWYQDSKAPVVLGHEPVGDVVAAGEGAPFAVGDRVFVHHHVPCLECDLCRRGRDTLCERFRATRIHPGGLAELILVPAENTALDVHRLPDSMSDEMGTLIEPLACILRGQRLAGVGEGSHVVIVGAGSMGLIEAELAPVLGAARVVVIEPNADRRPAAEALGATVLPACDPEAVRSALGGRLADQVIVCTHNHAAMNDALHLAGPASVVQYFAPTPPGEMVPLDLGSIFWREVELQSTYSAGPADIRDALAMLDDGRVRARGIVTHHVPFDEVHEGFRLARTGEALKVVIDF